jgi:AraC-binding-like domain
MMDRVRPLDNFPLIRTRNPEELQEAMAKIYARPHLELRDPVKSLNATINNCPLQQVRLSYFTYGTAVRLGFSEAGYYSQLFPIRGSGEVVIGKTVVPITADRGATISAETAHERMLSADYEHLILRIGSAALSRKLTAMTGASIDQPLRMHPVPDFRNPAAQMLHRYFTQLTDELSSSMEPLPAWALTQIEQMLMVMFLYANHHNYSHLLEQEPLSAARGQVRRAEEYLETHCNQPSKLEDLAEISGVSSLSLFRSFKQSKGCSPREFAKQIRQSKKNKH